jgi:hypothetical protein
MPELIGGKEMVENRVKATRRSNGWKCCQDPIVMDSPKDKGNVRELAGRPTEAPTEARRK